MEHPHPDFPSFELAVPSVYAGDPLWNVRMFRMASYLSGRARGDAVRLGLHSRLALADQFVRAVGSGTALIVGERQPLTTDDSDSHGSTRINTDTAMAESGLVAHETTRVVLGAFFYVYNTLGHGFLESVYHRALGNTLERVRCAVEREADLRVYFEELEVGVFRADLIVNRRVIVEVKAMDRLTGSHEAQLINYLRAAELPVGQLLNFGPRATYRRLVGPPTNQRGQPRVRVEAST